MKKDYIALMAKVLEAYSDAHIQEYFDRVRAEGLTEHGFPRLTANIGVLMSYGIRTDLKAIFCEMMDFCCENIPKVLAANDFSVREIVCCIMTMEVHNTVPAEKIQYWKDLLGTICPQTCYDCYAKTPDEVVYNWACFTLVSEYMRQKLGLCDSAEFIDIQIATQLRLFEENGMYRDPADPMVYDLVPRMLLAFLCHEGYRGKYYEQMDTLLQKAGLHTLQMQSVTGEVPFGGRSNQFLFNEAVLAAVMEYEAIRWAKAGDTALAGRYKSAAKKAMASISRWLEEKTIRHIKNRFPLESQYGCEFYAYFDKYMITTASFLYVACLICDDSVLPYEEDTAVPEIWQTSPHFHKVFLRSGAYFLEWDTKADTHYDCSGLGRIHKQGAPSALCMSTPCTAHPNYTTDCEDSVDLSLCPGIYHGGKWQFGTDANTVYTLVDTACSDQDARLSMRSDFSDTESETVTYAVNENGIDISAVGDGKIGYMLPAFCFDGENCTEIRSSENILEICYEGWVCRYTTDGKIEDTEKIACNRNGHYRVFAVTGTDNVHLHIEIEKHNGV